MPTTQETITKRPNHYNPNPSTQRIQHASDDGLKRPTSQRQRHSAIPCQLRPGRSPPKGSSTVNLHRILTQTDRPHVRLLPNSSISISQRVPFLSQRTSIGPKRSLLILMQESSYNNQQTPSHYRPTTSACSKPAIPNLSRCTNTQQCSNTTRNIEPKNHQVRTVPCNV